MKFLIVMFSLVGPLSFGSNQTEGKPSIADIKMSGDFQNGIGANEQLDKKEVESIKKLIAIFKTKNSDKISAIISFPLQRQSPLPPIKNKEEFRKRFREVFDDVLLDKIITSKIDQWSKMGWRGIMLDDGLVWMGNSDGIITAVNHQSDFEKKRRGDLIEKEKQNLHGSLTTFESPVYKIETKNFLIRIDKLANETYRYASWKINQKESLKPSIILVDGKIDFQGSGGNHVITFINGIYVYHLYRNVIGEEDMPEITLEVEKNGRIILSEEGKLKVERM